MAKKSWVKTLVGIGALAVAGKVLFDKYKKVKEEYTQEENDSLYDEVKKYNAICQKKVVEVDGNEFTGCEVKTVMSSTVIDLGFATIEQDSYINFTSTASGLTIIVPEDVNVVCDINNVFSGVRNLVDNSDEEGIYTLYLMGKAICSSIEVVPVNFYVDEEEDEDLDCDVLDFDDSDDFDDEEIFEDRTNSFSKKAKEVAEDIKEAASEIKEKVTPVVESVKEKAAPVVESVKEKAAPVVEEMTDKASSKVKSIFGVGKKVYADVNPSSDDEAIKEDVTEEN